MKRIKLVFGVMLLAIAGVFSHVSAGVVGENGLEFSLVPAGRHEIFLGEPFFANVVIRNHRDHAVRVTLPRRQGLFPVHDTWRLSWRRHDDEDQDFRGGVKRYKSLPGLTSKSGLNVTLDPGGAHTVALYWWHTSSSVRNQTNVDSMRLALDKPGRWLCEVQFPLAIKSVDSEDNGAVKLIAMELATEVKVRAYDSDSFRAFLVWAGQANWPEHRLKGDPEEQNRRIKELKAFLKSEDRLVRRYARWVYLKYYAGGDDWVLDWPSFGDREADQFEPEKLRALLREALEQNRKYYGPFLGYSYARTPMYYDALFFEAMKLSLDGRYEMAHQRLKTCAAHYPDMNSHVSVWIRDSGDDGKGLRHGPDEGIWPRPPKKKLYPVEHE